MNRSKKIHKDDVGNLYRMFLIRNERFEVRGRRVWLIDGEPLFNPPPSIVDGGWEEVLLPYLIVRKN